VRQVYSYPKNALSAKIRHGASGSPVRALSSKLEEGAAQPVFEGLEVFEQ
jgi:hypothetical protein